MLLRLLIITAVIFPSVSSSAVNQPYHIDCMKFPEARHPEIPQVHEDYKFDPSVHLQIEPPSWVKTLNFEKVDYPNTEKYELAYSEPFRVVSDEGLQRLRQAIDTNKNRVEVNKR